MRLDQAAFASPRFATLFADFGAWLEHHAGAQRAALSIHRYLPFFAEIEQHWSEIPTYPPLVEHFGAEGLRRVRLPMEWLVENGFIAVDATTRTADSERRRVAAVIASVPAGTIGADAILAYKDRLQARVDGGKSTVRSMRLALRPAASLILAADAFGHTLPDQIAVDRFLREAPGQLAALTGFIRFLNEEYALALAAAIDEARVAERRRKYLESMLMNLAQNGRDGDAFLLKWLRIGLAYFHGLTGPAVNQTSRDAIEIDPDGYRVLIGDKKYWLPTWQSVAATRGATDLQA